LTSHNDDKDNKSQTFGVPIEKDVFLEFTTEEEDNTLSQSNYKDAFGRSTTNVNEKTTEKKKKRDHLKLFEKQMSAKF